jgi:hypothetical protein
MKRDLNLIRKILLAVESADTGAEHFINVALPGYTAEEISYHVGLLAEGGYLAAHDFFNDGQHTWTPLRLTWEGHEFLAVARDDTIWHQGLELLKKAGASLGLPALATLLEGLVKTYISFP